MSVTGCELPSGSTKRKYAHILCPGDERIIPELDNKRARELEAMFQKVNGGPAKESEACSPAQLAALAGRIAVDDVPYADFSIFGLFGSRMAKLMSFQAQMFVDGVLVTKKLPGPNSFEAWRRCWRVFRTGMLKLRAALPGPLDAYEEGIRQLNSSFPQYWGLIALADDIMRSERWEMVRVRIEDLAANGQLREPFDKNMPWNAVLSWTAYDTGNDSQWWYNRVDKPCMQSGSPMGAMARAAEIEGSAGVRSYTEPRNTESEGAHPSEGFEPEQNHSGARRARDMRRLENRAAAVSTGVRPDGRFMTTEDGQEICYSWNRSETGCSQHGGCSNNPPKAHRCEWCRGAHKAIDNNCPAHRRPLNWKLAEQNTNADKGRGKGRW